MTSSIMPCRPRAAGKLRTDYARFLALQYAARVPLEGWLARHAPRDLSPPPQTLLLARDLEALGWRAGAGTASDTCHALSR